jgi:hypothetical protein
MGLGLGFSSTAYPTEIPTTSMSRLVSGKVAPYRMGLGLAAGRISGELFHYPTQNSHIILLP